MHWIGKRLRTEDSGAVAAVVAVLAGGGVLLGLGLVVVDVGQVYVERSELQNGADAGALAMARQHALGLTPSVSLAAGYAAKNSTDGKAAAAVTYPGTNRVTVTASTVTAGGTVLPTFFGGQFGRTNDGHISATATARWGQPGAAKVIPVTFDYCEWATSTFNGTSWDHIVDLKLMDPGADLKKDPGACPADPAGKDYPGGFGWLTNSGTSISVTAGGTVTGVTGVSGNDDVTPIFIHAIDTGELVLIPIFDSATKEGVYHLRGFGAFRLLGYRLPALHPNNYGAPATPAKALRGYFTRALVSVEDAGFGTSWDGGAAIVKLVD
jgi:hypothetical protein